MINIINNLSYKDIIKLTSIYSNVYITPVIKQIIVAQQRVTKTQGNILQRTS